ncbi:centromere protein M isoform X3 [Tursiops truncatus]|uniref:centromere protein M isoform X3 n=1 Tax=Tursiops truncatus TaxID=9739 RepID=UPI003CCF5BA1
MSVLRPLDKLPGLNTATILLVGTEDALLQQLAEAMLKEDCTSELKVHLAKSLPLPSNVNRPRIDLIVFVVNLHSKHSLRNVEESLHHVDATFFLGKLGGRATAAFTGTPSCSWPTPTGAPCSSATWRGHRFEPWSGRISHATEQLSPCTTTTEPAL